MNLKLSDIQYAELRKLQRNKAGTPGDVRVICILMLHNGCSPQTFSENLGISQSSVYRYINQYQKDAIEELLNDNYKGVVGYLGDIRIAALCKELKEYIGTDSKHVTNWILSFFGVQFTQQGVVDLLNRICFSYKKTTDVPCEANADAQSESMAELAKTLKEKNGEFIVNYADWVHSTHNIRLTYAWIEKGKVMEPPINTIG